MGCHSLLVGFQECVEYPLAQLVSSLCSASEVCFIRNLEAFRKLTTDLAVVLLYGSLQGLIIQEFWPATAWDTSAMNFWEQCLAMHSLTALSTKA